MKFCLLRTICAILLGAFFVAYLPVTANAQTASDFLGSGAQNNILSNENFIDINSMDVATIQAFLIANNSTLKDYIDTSAVGANRSASQIIYDASRGLYDASVGTAKGITIDSTTGTISPKVILVFLQKEQSLITTQIRDENALNRAMGYSCPDNGSCNPAYAGFAMQVGWGAWQLRYNYEASKNNLDWWNTNYGVGNTSTCYVGQTKTFVDYTGSYTVTLSNATTASIYRYTPHVFDSAYNVWNLFNYTFFPSSTPAPAPPAPGETPATEPSPPPPPPPPRKAGDGNGDNTVDSTDLSILADQWGKNVTTDTGADFSKDGIVDSTDLSILADGWGK